MNKILFSGSAKANIIAFIISFVNYVQGMKVM